MTARRMGGWGIPFAPRTKSVNRFKATGKKQKAPATPERGSSLALGRAGNRDRVLFVECNSKTWLTRNT
jgi:hypothetical protein